MYELVISTNNGARHSILVRDHREASAELIRFKNEYFRNHPNDRLLDASVLNRLGDRVSRLNGNRLGIF